MENTVNNEETVYVPDSAQKPEEITKADLRKTWLRWYLSVEMSHSFSLKQGASFMWSLVPTFKKLYKTKERLSEAYTRHLQFFNTNANWGGGTILGVITSMEETKAKQEYETGHSEISDDALYNIKAGLMGALAGVGDSIDTFTIMYIFISIFLPWGQSGNWLGAFLPWLLFTIYQLVLSWGFINLGYGLGTQAASELLNSQRSKSIIDVLSVLGLWMMGVLVASYVNIETSFTWTTFQGEQSLQSLLDSILPGLLPFALTMLVYWYYTRKEFNIMKAVIWVTLLLGVLAAVGLL